MRVEIDRPLGCQLYITCSCPEIHAGGQLFIINFLNYSSYKNWQLQNQVLVNHDICTNGYSCILGVPIITNSLSMHHMIK